MYASGDESKYLIPEDGIVGFMEHCANRIGEAYFRTPRTTIKSFIDLLAVLEQNEEASWKSLVGKLDITADQDSGIADLPPDDDEFASFKL